MRRFIGEWAAIAAFIIASVLFISPANAQASRTWVSGVGDDANPCSRTAPCKTFAGSISKTAAGGEIDCLDPGGYGAVTITKSITLDCGGGIGGQVGSILASGTNGIVVNAAATDKIKIRNLSINGFNGSGQSGIKFNTAASLIVEHVGIFGFGGSSGSNAGIDFQPTVTAKLTTADVEIQNNLGDGILIKPTSTGSATVDLHDTRSLNNSGGGLRADTSGVTTGAGVNITVSNSDFSGNAVGVTSLGPAANATAVVTVTNSVLEGNSYALLSNSSKSTINIGGDTITGNGTGIGKFGSPAGSVKSWGDNYFAGNGADGTPDTPNLNKL